MACYTTPVSECHLGQSSTLYAAKEKEKLDRFRSHAVSAIENSSTVVQIALPCTMSLTYLR
jgi:hypothetical protein